MLATWLIAALPASYLLGYKGLFTRNGDLIRDLDKYVRSGQPCFSQLQNEVKNPFAYAKTRSTAKNPKFVYHYTDNESLSGSGAVSLLIYLLLLTCCYYPGPIRGPKEQ